MSDIVTVVIDRERWAHGGRNFALPGNLVNSLLNPDESMCCLGFAALQFGATKDEIRGEGLPYRVDSVAEKFCNLGVDQDFQNKLAVINDSKDLFTVEGRVDALNTSCRTKGAFMHFTLKEV